MKRKILLSLSLLLSIACVAQKQIDHGTNSGSIITTDMLKANSDTKDGKAVLSGWKALKSLNDKKLVDQLDSIVGITEFGTHVSKEAWEYNENFAVTSYKVYENHWSGVFCVVNEQYAEYDDRGYMIMAAVYVFWDPTTEQWDPSSKRSRYVVDDRGYIVEEYIDLLNTTTNEFINASWTLTTIDETDPENTLVTSIVKAWDQANQTYVDALKFEMAYDGHGNRIVYAPYTWTGTWVGEGVKYEDTYNYDTPVEDLIALRIESVWNFGTNSWEIDNTREHVFNALGNLVSGIVKENHGGELVVTQKELLEYLYDFILLSDKVYNVDGSNEVLVGQTLYSYEIIDDIVCLTGGLSLLLGGEMIQLTEVVMKYSGPNMIYLKEGADGEIYSEQEMEHDDAGRIIQQIDYGFTDWETMAWGPAIKYNFAYNNDGLVTESILANWEDGAFVNATKSTSTYNIDNIKTELYNYRWSNNAWVPSSGQLNKFDENIPASEVIMPLVFMGLNFSYKLIGMALLAGDGQGGFYETETYTAHYSEVIVENPVQENSKEKTLVYIVDHTLFIDSSIAENVAIYNVTGNLMLSFRKSEGKVAHDVSRLASGLYIVKGTKWAEKVIKL